MRRAERDSVARDEALVLGRMRLLTLSHGHIVTHGGHSPARRHSNAEHAGKRPSRRPVGAGRLSTLHGAVISDIVVTSHGTP